MRIDAYRTNTDPRTYIDTRTHRHTHGDTDTHSLKHTQNTILTTLSHKLTPHLAFYNNRSDEFFYSPNYLSGFSSKGPTRDMRIKPDVVAAGEKITSAKALGTVFVCLCVK